MRGMGLAWVAIFGTGNLIAQGNATAPGGLAHQQVDNLTRPLGIDDATPRFSWQLNDSAPGARQTAYRLLVATRAELLMDGKADVWDSGKVTSARSLNVKYGGPSVKPSTQYWWRVEVSGLNGKAYPASAAEWWETGLLGQGWRGEWIGWETREEDAVRKAPAAWIANPDAVPGAAKPNSEQIFAYRKSLSIDKPVERAVLFATGEDTVSAWVNGDNVMTAAPYPTYHHLAWQKFERGDVTGQVKEGQNTIAIKCMHYVGKYGEDKRKDAPPMMATLLLFYKDGTASTVVSDRTWTTAVLEPSAQDLSMGPPESHVVGATRELQPDPAGGSGWKNVVVWAQQKGPEETPVLNPWMTDSVKVLWKSFEAGKSVKSARLYATALGTYEVSLNGAPVNGTHVDWMAPGWTDYRERVLYQTYDVTDMVKAGQNWLEALLAPGWYSTPLEWLGQPNNYGDTPPAFKAQLRIEHEDGSVEWVATDASWKADTSYILNSELYDGETQDLGRLPETWNRTGEGAKKGEPAKIVHPKEISIEAQSFEPIRVEKMLTGPKMTEPKPGVFIYDFGQNMAGVEKLSVTGPAGTDVQVRTGETLNPDGTLYTENLRTAKATDHFILGGQGIEELVPQFTFHGFRYIEVTGLKSAPEPGAVSALVLHTDFPFTAKLTTGNEMVNKLWSNILWGERSNFVGLPTDCSQRDERLGWMADAQVFWRAASYNADLAAFTRKFAADERGTQVGTPYYGIIAPGTARIAPGVAAAWSDAGVIIPWTSWLQTGDTSVIDENWSAMRKYVDGIDARNPDGIWHNDSGIPFGDWLSLEGRTLEDVVATAYWAYDVNMLREMAHATGRTEAEQHYAQLEAKIREAFQKKFVHEGAYIPGADYSPSPFGDIDNPNAKPKGGDTQTTYVLALHMNLLPEAMRAEAAGRLVKKIEENHGLLGTGFVGTPYLLEELTKTGHTKLAYDLLLNTGMPSWGYQVEHGATTTWERWNGDLKMDDPQMNSLNHYAYGAVADWIYRFAAGVDASPLDAGFHTVVLHPEFDARLSPLKFEYESSYGEIESSWTMKGKTVEWNVTLPANTTGRLEVKTDEAAWWTVEGVRLSESPLAKKVEGGFELEAGSYRFVRSRD
ncbi:MAG TPA: family 78 glycoside hydrolase catalytic domain [Terracidiphilus sp.]|nr:family 78 glycoside hydrolase catalytic domain [Terracidiphilus sp.]